MLLYMTGKRLVEGFSAQGRASQLLVWTDEVLFTSNRCYYDRARAVVRLKRA